MNKHLRLFPAYLAIIIANLLPIYGAAIGKLFFFQVIYLYWFESVLVIFFNCIRIVIARGDKLDAGFILSLGKQMLIIHEGSGFFYKLKLIIKYIIVRMLILCFYLLFLVVFIGFQLTAKDHRQELLQTVIFQNTFFNTSLMLFMISMTVQLITGFLMNGQYKVMSPLNYNDVFDSRTIMLHVMIVGTVFIHKIFFEGTPYVALGEIAYVGIFMLIKSVAEIYRLKKAQKEHPDEMVMI